MKIENKYFCCEFCQYWKRQGNFTGFCELKKEDMIRSKKCIEIKLDLKKVEDES